MSCLKIKLERKNFPLSINSKITEQLRVFTTYEELLNASINDIIPYLKVKTMKASTSIEADIFILCKIGIYDGWEVFLVKEGIFLLSDGKKFKVIKHGISK